MGDNKDLEDIAKSTGEDFYLLLGVDFEAAEGDIKRAYRKVSLRYHPDKNPDDPNAADKFILCGIARDILSSPTLKVQYDQHRMRKKERALQNDLLDSRRRKMKEDLEARERGAAQAMNNLKRKRQEEMNETEKRELEIERLAEEGAKRRKEFHDRQKREKEEEEASFMEPSPRPQKPAMPGQTSEIDRTVRVRFSKDGETATWDKETVSRMFEKYGSIESAVIGKDKKLKVPGLKHRKMLAIVFIVYTRLDHAHAAVVDGKADFPAIEDVTWAAKEPEMKSPLNGEFSAPSTPYTTPNKPARASFGTNFSKLSGTPGTPSFSFSPKTPKGASLEELTMMRLKQAEKKRLEEQIRKQEAAEEAAALTTD